MLALSLAVGACAGPSTAEAYNLALAGDLPVADSLDLCERAGDQSQECAAAVIRERPEASGRDCHSIESAEWRSECFFSIAERQARAGDRFGALASCAGAGGYYHECLYHGWTYELQGTVQGGGRAVSQVDAAREVVAFWGQVQTVQGDAQERMWLDWWYFALNRNRPADITECTQLEGDDRDYCEKGHVQFVQRAITEVIQRPRTPPQLKARMCRGGYDAVAEVRPNLYVTHPDLDALTLPAIQHACVNQRGTGLVPWSPTFVERRPWAAG
ncbi:MAG: hypothetical protein FJ090_09875 [Deltaproteobacteria bacterium]|nr:hypothetical protein [Deltaproteobacteria bacterium]